MNRKKSCTKTDGKITVMAVFGTRPEAVKMCPLILELKKRQNIHTVVTVTGQHRQMLDQVLAVFGILPDYDLSVMKKEQTLFDITTAVLNGMRDILNIVRPDILLVHGDTSTALAASLAAFYLKIPVGHVEAGLRTYNKYSPYPEEFNREAVGSIASFHFAPTQIAADNLLREGKKRETIFITGNTAIDALKTTVRKDYHHPELSWANDSRLILITAHRRENLNHLRGMFRAVRRVMDEHPDVKAIYPVHLNPMVREAAENIFGASSAKGCEERIHLINPLDVSDFHNFMANSYLILTDSGGIQEEAPSLGKPVLVMRDTTERPEGMKAGTLKLAGTSEERIYAEFKNLLEDEEEYGKMAHASNPYGDGKASIRIADIIEYGITEIS